MRNETITQAVILAGGLGIRLKPLTLNTPKPMISIHSKPFLEYIIESLSRNGIKELVILTGYLGKQIENYFKDGCNYKMKISYSDSGINAGTGLRLRNAMHLLNDTFLLLYGDNFWPLNLAHLYNFYKTKKAEALVTVYSNLDGYTKSNMFVDLDSKVKAYKKSNLTKTAYNGVDIGYFILQKKHISLLPKEDSSFEEVMITKLVNKNKLFGFITHHRYYGLSNPDRIKNIQEYFKPKKVVFLDRDGVINKKAPKAEYITKWQDFKFIPNAVKALQLLSKRNYQIFIITNQAGIARGIMKKEQIEFIHNKMINYLKKKGIKIHGIYVCPHGWNEGCFCRKPQPGLFFQAASDHAINLYESFCIGDDLRDVDAAVQAGCKAYLIGRNKSFYDIVSNYLL